MPYRFKGNPRWMKLSKALLPLNAAVCVLFMLPLLVSSSFASVMVGPVLGEVSHTTAKWWVYAEGGATIQLELVPAVIDAEIKLEKSKFSTSSHFVSVAGLAADTSYQYQLLINGNKHPLHSGQFKTSPLPGQPSKFSIAVISCLKKASVDWGILEKENPDYLFMLGDNIYTNQRVKDSFEKMRQIYLEFRQNEQFVSLVKNRPTLAVWDDHDMGPNNSDGTLKGKETSLEAFMDVWPNPSYGTKEVPGVFFTKQHGDVEFFMLDGRYYRQPKKTVEARLLGDGQLDWLVGKLKASQATFKIIANGSPINDTKPKDGWESWPWARKRLYDAISKNKITGVVFVGGDLHFADLEIIPSKKTGIPYPIYNIVSSGFADSRSRQGWNFSKQEHPYVILNVDTTLAEPTLEILVKDKNQTFKRVTVNASELQ